MSLAVVAVLGRPNVGKSTLINRVASSRATITHQMPGVTRDRKYVEVEWFGKDFVLIDTGGFEFKKGESMSSMVAEQAKISVEEAEAVIFIVDAKEGLHPYDREIADLLRKSGKKIYLAANKIDTEDKKTQTSDFYGLGLGDVYALSASHGLGVNELFDDVSAGLPDVKEKPDERISVAIVGRPNAGKSSLLNKLLGQERVIVSEIPGTTRDAIDSIVTFEDREWRFIDTAGLKRKRAEDVEYYGTVRTLEALDRADIALVLIDSTESVTEQDKRIIDYALSRGCGLAVLLNKWDLVDEEQKRKLEKDVDRKLHFIDFVPILDISAKTGKGIKKVFKHIKNIEAEYARTIKTSELNKFLRQLDINRFPTKHKIRIGYVNQLASKPPKFLFFVTSMKAVSTRLTSFLEGNLRRAFGFEGTPVKILYREKK